MSPPACRLGIAVDCGADCALLKRVYALAGQLALPTTDEPDAVDLVLRIREDGLALGPPGSRTAVSVDFVGGAGGYRRFAKGSNRQPLARAIGMHKGIRRIVDATAGLGRDAFQLAALGCTVTAVERSSILALMLREARCKALIRGTDQLREVLTRLEVVSAESGRFLLSLDDSQRPQAVYVDPMFPPRFTKALTKKELRIVRILVGDDSDSGRLVAAARRVATRRVVVKRPGNVAPLAPDLVASHSGSRVCYDVYAPF